MHCSSAFRDYRRLDTARRQLQICKNFLLAVSNMGLKAMEDLLAISEHEISQNTGNLEYECTTHIFRLRDVDTRTS
jgi:hypothetical protein